MKKKLIMSDFWNIGISIVLCAAIGIVLGVLLNNVSLWLCIGSGVGVVLGTITQIK